MAAPIAFSRRAWNSSFRKTLLLPTCQDLASTAPAFLSPANLSSMAIKIFRLSSL